MKPDPSNPQELYLGSLEAVGIDTHAHDIRLYTVDNQLQVHTNYFRLCQKPATWQHAATLYESLHA